MVAILDDAYGCCCSAILGVGLMLAATDLLLCAVVMALVLL